MNSLPLEVIKQRWDTYLSQRTYGRDSCISVKILYIMEIPGFLWVPDNISGESSPRALFSHLQIEPLKHRRLNDLPKVTHSNLETNKSQGSSLLCFTVHR